MTQYETRSGEPVPEAVAETFDDSEDWTGLNPNSVPVHATFWGEVYEGQVGGHDTFVEPNGREQPDYRFLVKCRDGALPSETETVSYTDKADVVHPDHFTEHVTRVIVVTAPETRAVFGSRSGVVWPEYYMDRGDSDVSRDVLQIAGALADASNDVEPPEDIQQATSGWHSSLEQSDQSDMMNALAKGDIPIEWVDKADPFPYVVRYGDSRNVCSVNASIYGNAHFRACVRDAFEGSRSAPAFGGFTA